MNMINSSLSLQSKCISAVEDHQSEVGKGINDGPDVYQAG